MSIQPDPYRVLGLSRSASADEIRRAYRRLAKENHPDSAGEKALPRFLAIQAAYELLAGGPSTRRTSARSTTIRPTPRDPWRADPDRAPPTGDPSRRAGRPQSGSGPAGAGTTTTGPAGPAGQAAAGSSNRPRREPPPAGSGGAGRAGNRGGRSAGTPGGTDRPRRDGRKRAPNKATLGSTSYDAADQEPFEPEWSGGTWYGASSGTYWTINPKEYADPRKHGPEYQARARRRTGRGSAAGARAAAEEPWEADPDEPAEAASGEFAPDESPGSTSTWDAAAGPGPAQAAPDGIDPLSALAQVALSMAGTPRGFMARVVLALLGWPAIGLALTTVTGEMTGCGRFAASCIDVFGVGTWLAQLVIITILLALPSLAALSVVGSLVALAASVPTAVILSASGGSREPALSASILGVVLVTAYAAGVLAAIVRRRRSTSLP